jgi:hypothetical protein
MKSFNDTEMRDLRVQKRIPEAFNPTVQGTSRSGQLFVARVSSKAGRALYVSPPFGSREAAAADAFQARPRAGSCSTSRAGFAPAFNPTVQGSGRVEDLHSDIRWHRVPSLGRG